MSSLRPKQVRRAVLGREQTPRGVQNLQSVELLSEILALSTRFHPPKNEGADC